MPFNPQAIRIAFLILIGGGFVYWWIGRKTEHEIYIALPFVRPLNTQTTLQWEPVKRDRPDPHDDGNQHSGFALAKVHCTRCHLFPEPSQLPRETWPFVLTWMSNYLGFTNTYGPFGNNVEGSLIASEPLLSGEAFQKLAEYYMLYSAAEEQQLQPSLSRPPRTEQFGSSVPQLGIPPGGLVTMLDFDEHRDRLYVGLGGENVVHVFDASGRLILTKGAHSEPVRVETNETGFRMTSMGRFMENQQEGRVVDVSIEGGQLRESKVVEGYHRLTESHTLDLDDDGVDDLVLVGFGAGVEGQVSIRWGQSENELVLIDYAGALNARFHDFDSNGMKDILVITSQQKQEILLFLNRGKREFERRLIHQEFAGFGFNHIEHADLNGDGREDLLVVNGNNMEIKDAPLKPYHGIRVFENQGDLNFVEAYFYPMHGALKALAHDFDGDGDLDIAGIAFYPDWTEWNPETFVYLENQGGYSFQSSGLSPKETGRWMSMCRGDMNGDGWQDIVLGGAYIPQGVKTSERDRFAQWAEGRPSVLVLTNLGRE